MKKKDEGFLSREARISRVEDFFSTAGVALNIHHLNANTSTAVLAAAALNCQVAQIAKSIVFKRADNHQAVVAVLCGDQRVSLTKLAAIIGADLQKVDADYVRKACGFEIGGVPPVAHKSGTHLILEDGLKAFANIWAAAGSAHAVFNIAPLQLAEVTQARFANFAESQP